MSFWKQVDRQVFAVSVSVVVKDMSDSFFFHG